MFVEGGTRLEEERRRLGLNQDAMAVAAGVAKSTYCNYEAGKRAPDANCMASLFEAGVDVLYVLSGQRSAAALSAEQQHLLAAYEAAKVEYRVAALAALTAGPKPNFANDFSGGVGSVVQGDATFNAPVLGSKRRKK